MILNKCLYLDISFLNRYGVEFGDTLKINFNRTSDVISFTCHWVSMKFKSSLWSGQTAIKKLFFVLLSFAKQFQQIIEICPSPQWARLIVYPVEGYANCILYRGLTPPPKKKGSNEDTETCSAEWAIIKRNCWFGYLTVFQPSQDLTNDNLVGARYESRLIRAGYKNDCSGQYYSFRAP